ncbi:MAG: archease [Candidatus Thermoplasmatota archaeon]|jgi:SHS2 domain-containing protein|nr:archease [Candidatus Thermoplasmatota archaeon]
MNPDKYEIIEHTADIGIRAYGKTLSEAFENAAKGMFDIITDKSEVESVGQYEIRLDAPDLEQLLVDWLSELLFLNTSQNLVFGFFKVEIDEKKKTLRAQVFGEKYNISKHKVGTEIKAVTYHMLEVKNKKPYHVQVLFDI